MRAAAAVIVAVVMFLGTGAVAKDRLVWAEIDFPPFSIVDGPMKGAGIVDKTLDYFISRMPGFDHDRAVFPILRMFQLLGASENYCYPSAAKTAAREKIALFSHQIYWLKPIHVALRAGDLERFAPVLDADGAVDPARLLASPDLAGAIVLGRAYHPLVDRAIGQAVAPGNIFKAGDNMTIFRMISRGRIDWTFAYAEEGTYYMKLLGEEQPVTALPIAGSQKVVGGYIACSPGPVGERAITAINRIAAEAGSPPAYFDYYAEWLPPDLFAGVRNDAFPAAARP